MTHHSMMIAALFGVMLMAGPCAQAQDTPAATGDGDAQVEGFSASGLVEQIVQIGIRSGNRLGVDDPDGLTRHLQSRYDELTTLADAADGEWGFDFNINFTTDTPDPDACDDPVVSTLTTRQPLELVGTLCRTITIADGLSSLTQDRVLGAPFGEMTLHVSADTTMSAEDIAVRDAGSTLLMDMATALIEALILTPDPGSSPDRVDWQALVGSLADGLEGFMHFPAPDRLAANLAAMSEEMEDTAHRYSADWAITVSIDGNATSVDRGILDTEAEPDTLRPDSPPWCHRAAPLVVNDPTGAQRIWQHCTGTPPGESPDSLAVRIIWLEEVTPRSALWLELTAVGALDTPRLQADLDTMIINSLLILTEGMIIGPVGHSPR